MLLFMMFIYFVFSKHLNSPFTHYCNLRYSNTCIFKILKTNNIPPLRKQLCPSLVAIMGNPVNDKTIASHHGYMWPPDRDRLTDRLSLGNWIYQRNRCEGGLSHFLHLCASWNDREESVR